MKFNLWLEFEQWESKSDDDPYNDYFNAQIEFESGETYALNIWTFKFFEAVTDELYKTKEPKYIICPDLLVEKMDRHLIESCISKMIEKNELKKEWLILDEESDAETGGMVP